MADIKWSAFPDGAAITSGDETVGLRAGANTRLTANEFDNLSLNVNTIASTDTNGPVVIAPNGTGNILLQGSTLPSAQSNGVVAAKDGTACRYVAASFLAGGGNGADYLGFRSRSTTVGAFSPVSTGDLLTTWRGFGDDGTTFVESTRIRCDVEGTVSTGVVPGRLTFYTANTSGTITSAMSINSSQNMTVVGSISGVTQLNVDNLRLDGNTLSSTDTNGPVVVAPNGTGSVRVGSATAALPGAKLQVAKDATQGTTSICKYTTADQGALLYLLASRSATVGGVTTVGPADILGNLYFSGTDGTSISTAAAVRGRVDGTVSAGVVPGALEFYTTTAAGAQTLGMTLDKSQNLTVVGSISGVTQLSVDNLRLDGNTLSSTNTNGNVIISPNGVGALSIETATPNMRLEDTNSTGSAAIGYIEFYDQPLLG
jgi:hypothetical protein